MANNKSALKQAKQSEKRRLRNKSVKTRVKNVIKTVHESVSEKSIELSKENFIKAQSIIDKAGKKGVLHKRNASRKISRLSKLINKI